MNKIECVLSLIVLNLLTVNSKILYVFCGLLLTPQASVHIDELRQFLYIFYLNRVRNARLRQIIESFNWFADHRQGAKKISFVGKCKQVYSIISSMDSSVKVNCLWYCSINSQIMKKARVMW